MRLRRLEPCLRRALRGRCAVPRGTRVLVAVSGGADSTALLLGLASLAREFDLRLSAAHLDHGLRGAASRADARFCRELCRARGIPFECGRIDARARMRRRGLSGEDGLRVLRHAWLRAAARRAGADVIALGHTADDQLETLLLRLARGTGLYGLGGIRARSGATIRPLLEATRAEIEADLAAAGQPWREDASNRDPAMARNRVRHAVVPALLASLGRAGERAGARERLARRAAAAAFEAAEAADVLRDRALALLSRRSRIQGGETSLDSRGWCTYAPAIRRSALRVLWARVAPEAGGLTHRHLAALDRLALGGRGGSRVALEGGREALRDRGVVRFRATRAPAAPGAGRAAEVPVTGAWSVGAVRGRWTRGDTARRGAGSSSPREEYFAAEGLAGGLELREGRADEWFTPFGRRRPVRLGEFLRKQAVTRDLRSHPTVLADADGILWVVGVRRSARAPLTAATRRALRVHVEIR